MKKSLQLITALALSFFTMESKAQLADGSTAPDFTFTDMNGNTQHLYAYLSAGKAVIIDVSATWCGPCWAYHNSGALDQFYAKFGPSGNNTAMVILIEGDPSTDDTDMKGTGSNTQGDWTANTAYPECNPPANLINPFDAASGGYNITYFPNSYLICPDKKTTMVDQYTESQLEAAVTAACPAATSANDAGVSAVVNPSGTACNTSITPTITVRNYGSSTLTSCTINYQVDGGTVMTQSWTGSLTTNTTANATLQPITGLASGAHTFTSYTSNPNGSTDGNAGNDQTAVGFYVSTSGATLPVVEGFESGLATGWSIWNPDNNTAWEVTTKAAKTGTSSMFFDNCTPPSDITGQKDRFITIPYNFSGATSASMTFDVAYAKATISGTVYADTLNVYSSIDCGTTWTKIYGKGGATLATAPDITAAAPTCFVPTSGQWRNDNITLGNNLLGQSSVLFAFENRSGWAEGIYVDNINITAVTGIPSISSPGGFNIYPNPATTSFTVVGASTAEKINYAVYNAIGQQIITGSINGNGSTFQGNVQSAGIAPGTYFMRVNDETHSWVQKLTIQ